VNALRQQKRYKLASRVTIQTMTPPMTKFNVPRNLGKAKTSYHKNSRERSEFYCKEHGPNPTHNTSACKVFLNGGRKDDWKKKDTSKSKCSDCKSKCKKKHAELNLLQRETKKEKAKWTKAYKNLKSIKEADNVTGKESESSESKEAKKATAKTQTHPDNSDTDSDSSSDSSSSSDSNSE
jgi:hypothetical protein